MREPFFSVIIPVFNNYNLLNETLVSLSHQNFSDYEVIVVDDGSTESHSEPSRFNFTEFKFYKQENKGPGSARNTGAKISAGKYLVFLDSDDLFFTHTLSTYKTAILKFNYPDFLTGKEHVFEKNFLSSQIASKTLNAKRFKTFFDSYRRWEWWGASSFVIKRSAFFDSGQFVEDKVNAEDIDLTMKLGTCDGFVRIIEPETFGYRIHSGNITGNFSFLKQGLLHLIETENLGLYPGGDSLKYKRIAILTRHIRPFIMRCLKESKLEDSDSLFKATFLWHLRLLRLKFLVLYICKRLIK